MSEVTLLSTALPDLLPMRDRSPGIHVSDIIHDLCLRLGHYAPDSKDTGENRMALGRALEYSIVMQYIADNPRRYLRPGELILDDTLGTMDLFDAECEAVDEIKLTWMSSVRDHDDVKLWRYKTQLKAYCRQLGTRYGILEVVFVNGDYRGGDVEYRKWQIEFTDAELRENWAMLMAHKRRMQDER